MRFKRRMVPYIEALDARLVPSASTTAIPSLSPAGDVGDQVKGPQTAKILQSFVSAYLSRRGESRYNPEVDTNHNGFVGQGDARPILRTFASVTPRRPLRISLALAPGDQVRGPRPENSGGVTRRTDVTIIGRTTPNSLVFTDDVFGDFKFAGQALASDSQGFFSYKLHLSDTLTQNNYLAFDPFGHQTIRAFPILLLAR